MDSNLQVTLTQTRRGEPLAVVDGFPGGGAELTPTQLRALAAALNCIAVDLDARPTKAKHFSSLRRAYPLPA